MIGGRLRQEIEDGEGNAEVLAGSQTRERRENGSVRWGELGDWSAVAQQLPSRRTRAGLDWTADASTATRRRARSALRR